MNSLSLLLYFADVLPRFGGFLLFMSIIFAGMIVLFSIGSAVAQDPQMGGPKMLREATWIKWVLSFFFLTAMGAVMTPSKETIFLIAASELGEGIVTNQIVQTEAKEIYEILKEHLKVSAVTEVVKP